MKKIVNCGDALGGKNLSQIRTNALNVLDRRGEIEHVRKVPQEC
jgi:hypothetical protein